MDPVLTHSSGGVSYLTLNRPERLNAVSEELYRRLLAGLKDADADPDIRVVVLTGSGRAFCVGADLKAHGAGERTEADRGEYVELAWRVCEQIQRMGTPVIAAVNGYALGAGAEIAVSADFLVIADDAQVGFPEASIGTFVGGGVSQRLPRLVGLRRATELLLLGQRFTGRQAFDWGLAYTAVETDELQPAADKLARELAGKAPLSVAAMKAALVSEAPLDTIFRDEADTLLTIMKSADWAEGVAAFAARRQPVFRGM